MQYWYNAIPGMLVAPPRPSSQSAKGWEMSRRRRRRASKAPKVSPRFPVLAFPQPSYCVLWHCRGGTTAGPAPPRPVCPRRPPRSKPTAAASNCCPRRRESGWRRVSLTVTLISGLHPTSDRCHPRDPLFAWSLKVSVCKRACIWIFQMEGM